MLQVMRHPFSVRRVTDGKIVITALAEPPVFLSPEALINRRGKKKQERLIKVKKSLLISLILILLCALPVLAFAEKCPNGHNLDHVCPSCYYFYDSDVYHGIIFRWYCPQCGETAERIVDKEKHCWNGDSLYCSDCGYKRPEKETLRSRAIVRDWDVVGRQLFVMWKCKVYDSVNGRELMQLGVLDTYYVCAYRLDGQTPWIQIAEINRPNQPFGWIKAENASITATPDKLPEEYVIGKKVKVITSSGRGRTGAGTEYPAVAYVHYGEVYTVLDVSCASNGTQWYKLNVNGTVCWVSSGLVTLY